MFDIARDSDKAIQKVKIYLGDKLGLEKNEDCFIELGEPETFDTVKISSISKSENQIEAAVHYFDEIFDRVLLDHDFYDGTRKLETKEVHKFLFKKFDVINYILSEYMTKVFPSPRTLTEDK